MISTYRFLSFLSVIVLRVSHKLKNGFVGEVSDVGCDIRAAFPFNSENARSVVTVYVYGVVRSLLRMREKKHQQHQPLASSYNQEEIKVCLPQQQ